MMQWVEYSSRDIHHWRCSQNLDEFLDTLFLDGRSIDQSLNTASIQPTDLVSIYIPDKCFIDRFGEIDIDDLLQCRLIGEKEQLL